MTEIGPYLRRFHQVTASIRTRTGCEMAGASRGQAVRRPPVCCGTNPVLCEGGRDVNTLEAGEVPHHLAASYATGFGQEGAA
ncbi:hypothetical protein AB0891_33105, partial [Streptomyces sp. NPDC007259]|uniref:hypothetical protein n=1 Tax=Streptomyces sp. NPDC007259 TaxID=3154319 RepID=UPI003452343A